MLSGVRRNSRSRVSLRVLGSGDAFGTGGRYHTCFFLDAPRAKLLIDCGASSLVAMHHFGVDPAAIDGVVVTHLHGDHFAGLPFLFLDAAFITRRTRPLVIAGPRGTAERVRQATETLYPGFWGGRKKFAVRFAELADGRAVRVSGATVTAFRVVHDSGAPAFGVRVACGGCAVAYSGDTAWTERLIDVARGADLFLCEASSMDVAIPNHLTYETVAAQRERFDAARIVLTHAGADVIARRDTLALPLADDGQVFHLQPRTSHQRRRPLRVAATGGD
jgi:ribonuclease BN (tRNA processing enzyme)